MRVRLGVSVCMAALAVVASSARATTTARGVLVIGDSVATGMYWHDSAIAAMQKNLAVSWDVAVCRTIGGISCPFEGRRPATLLQVVAARHTVPATVVVIAGYNDPAATFAAEIDDAMSALVAAGARNVVWLTLRESRPEYVAFNTLLAEAEARWPRLVLVDWNAASQGHPSWFQNDDVHLTRAGGVGMAHLAHGAVTEILDPLHVRAPLWLRTGQSHSMRLRADGGTPPYRWRVAGGRPPRGFRLFPNGTLTVATTRPGDSLLISVTDADGMTALLPVLER